MFDQIKNIHINSTCINEFISKLETFSKESDLCYIPSDEDKNVRSEVTTPYELRQQMLMLIDEKNWKKNIKILEPCCGKGGFIIDIIIILLKKFSKNTQIKHMLLYKDIVENYIYFIDISKWNINRCKKILDPLNLYKLNYVIGDTLCNKTFENFPNYFDIIIGNPPYVIGTNIRIYEDFITYLIDRCNIFLFIIPSRWFISSSHINFRNNITKRSDIKYIIHENDSRKWFDNVHIAGGVNYFLKDKSYNGQCLFNNIYIQLNKYDVIIEPKYHKLIDSILIKFKHFLDELYLSPSTYGIKTNDKQLLEKGIYKCYVSKLKNNNRIMYINELPKIGPSTIKVITTRSRDSGWSSKSQQFHSLNILNKNEFFSCSYIGFRSKTLFEAKSIISYLKCDLPNYLLNIRKNTQDISENTLKWIPIVPFDKIWNNESLENYIKGIK